MKTKDFTGWIVAAVLAGIMAGYGFQTSAPKYAVVDVSKVATDCAMNKTITAKLTSEQSKRIDLLQFMSANPVISGQDVTNLRKLSLEDSPSDADKATLSGLEAKIQADEKKYEQLQSETTLSADDQVVMNDFKNRVTAVQQLLTQWDQEFSAQLQQDVAQGHQDVLNKVVATAAQVAKMQGCTLAFDSSSTPYCSIDLTAATLQAMDNQK